MRTLRVVLAAVALAPLTLLAPSQASERPVATLRPGKAAFWNGTGNGGDYTFDVKPGGWQLRVAYTHPDYRKHVDATLFDPSGKGAGALFGYMSGELFVPHPRPGRWSLHVNAEDTFRMRAKLEREPHPDSRPHPLLPNLQLVPPYEFTFTSLYSGGRGAFYDIGGDNPATSCTLDDHAEQQCIKGLRFSVGPANVGEGPLQLVFPPNEGLVLPGDATQTILWSDGHSTSRPAGQFVYHKTHAHYHHSGFGSLELLKVTDPAKGTTQPAGTGPKQGFCTADVVIADWAQFGAGRQNSADSTCDSVDFLYDPRKGTHMGLSAGWADIYSWEQDGNYVDFGVNTDGRYVVRSTADALHNIEESNETDNTSYAYIEVKGDTIKVLERGHGQGPWDRAKVVVHDGLNPNADR